MNPAPHLQLLHPRAAELISKLELTPHPEGGYFRETYRSAASVNPGDNRPERAALTTIYFLLTLDEVSRWHRVASDEVWHHIEGAPLELFQADTGLRRITMAVLGPFGEAAEPQRVVTAGNWQAARSTGDYTLVACIVAPGFDFTDFELLRDRVGTDAALPLSDPLLVALL